MNEKNYEMRENNDAHSIASSRVMVSLTDAFFQREMKTIKSTVFSKYLKHVKMHLELN